MGTGRQASSSICCAAKAASSSCARSQGFVLEEDNGDAEWLVVTEADAAWCEQKFAWNGGHDTDAVAGFAVGGNCAAMLKTRQGGQSVLRMACEGSPESCATKPTPQDS